MSQYIDNVWFERLMQHGKLSLPAAYLQDPQKRAEQKKLFFSGEVRNPTLDYPSLGTFDIENRMNKLRSLHDDVEKNEPLGFVKDAYMRSIQERLTFFEMLESTINRDFEKFNRLNEFAFSRPSDEITARIIPHVLDMIAQAEASNNALAVEAAQKLKELIKNIPADHDNALFGDYIHIEHERVSAKQISERFKTSLKENGIDDWRVKIDKHSLSSSIRINNSHRIIHIPATRTTNVVHLEALVRHEIGVHILRSKGAENGVLQLLTVGLDNYIRGDEGLSKYEEHQVFPSAFNVTLEMYLVTALVKGANGKPMDFRDAYEVFYNYYLVSKHGKSDLSEQSARSHGWRRASKLFRGTDGQQTGICFTKDLVYLHGYLDLLKVIEENPDEQSRFYSGKYDPSNEFHIHVLNELDALSKVS